MVNERVIVLLNCVSAGLVTPHSACNMFGDLGIGERLRENHGRVGLNDFNSTSFADNSDGGDDLVGPAEKHSCNSFSVFYVGGLAYDSAIEIDDGIGADYKTIREPLRDVVCLCQGQLFCILDGSNAFG